MDSLVIFNIKRPDVVHETIDDETVIVNLESGNYYSLRYTGVDVWNFIDGGASYEEISNSLSSKYAADKEEIKKAVRDLLMMFQKEGLVQTSSEKETASTASPPAPSGGTLVEFKAPLFEKYTDMQQVLLLDPVHEVTEEGWPHALEENDSADNQ